MSLSSFLLGAEKSKSKGKSRAIDAGLDDLFRSTAVAPKAQKHTTPSNESSAFTEKKRKAAPVETSSAAQSAKRSKRETDVHPGAKISEKSQLPRHESKHRESVSVASGSDSDADEGQESAEEAEADDGEEDADATDDSSEADVANDEEGEEDAVATNGDNDGDAKDEVANVPDSDDEGDPSQMVHEALVKGGKTGSSKKKYVPSEETPEQRNARTIFIGNVPVDVVKSRPLQKQLKRHILSFVPTAKIESARYRSVAFNKPTAQLPSDDSPSSSSKPPKSGRQHERERAATWRVTKSNDEEAAAGSGKVFLTPAEKKRVAFIKQEIHSGVDSVNAYIVFAHGPPVTEGQKAKSTPVMDPYEAAKSAIKEADGSVFMEHTIRVDTAAKQKDRGQLGLDGDLSGDPKATIFVGNLDYASKEEDLRAFFEGLMVVERGLEGKKSDSSDDEDEDEDAATQKTNALAQNTWVKRVRVIRDKDTLLGKGFAYVQFTDRGCVDEVLALEPIRLKFAKRKLRVQRCKTLPGATKQSKVSMTRPTVAKGERPTPKHRNVPPGPVPKGDPALGSKIAGLSKEDRKKVKSTDADRVARRLAKKQAKALADKGVKSRDKDRERVRRKPKDAMKKGAVDKGKKRVRSNKALLKMNTKK